MGLALLLWGGRALSALLLAREPEPSRWQGCGGCSAAGERLLDVAGAL